METRITKQNLSRAIVAAKLAKRDIQNAVKDCQILPEDDKHELEQLALILSADGDTIQSFLAKYERVGVASKKFAPVN